ncbi:MULTISPECIES: acyl-CoA thioesterase [unclassified Sphingomonas]|uniref:acyl-CoA thioesterase n=1 Tax=unclassified Sphingomonas TaxID=196159 RepID=UPI0019100A3B|nr:MULTISPECIES: thioesterase family protein [unclassified Sphingomonas]
MNRRAVQIEWGDCDPAGIVHYPRYFAMFDAATAALFAAALGYGKLEMIGRFGIVGFPMIDTGACFLAPSRFGDLVTIESNVTRFGRSSFEVAHRLLRGAAIAIEAHEKRVWAGHDAGDPARLKGRPIPHEVIDALSTFAPPLQES